jgi:two-component system NarL family response regulator
MAACEGPIKILIVDDHPVVRAGLTSMLGTRTELQVVGSALSGQDALRITAQMKPDVLLLDLRMPGMSGVETLRALKSAGSTARVIILTNYETDEDIYRAIQAGAQGYLLKDASLLDMVAAVRAVHGGGRYLPNNIALRLAERMVRIDLTPRELEILQLISKGLTNKQIGQALGISGHTVRNHVLKIIEKLEVSDRTEAATVAIQRGLIKLDE